MKGLCQSDKLLFYCYDNDIVGHKRARLASQDYQDPKARRGTVEGVAKR